MEEAVTPELLESLRAHPEHYRLLRRVPLTLEGVVERFPLRLAEPLAGEKLCQAVFLDTETTGFDARRDKIIELGMVRATFALERRTVLSVEKYYDAFEDPGAPIPPQIRDMTHITDDMVAGQSFDEDAVASFLAGRPLIIAHNAPFDRPFFDRRFPALANLSWACSMTDVPWNELGFTSRKLEILSMLSGYFYDAHRAFVDCLALLWLMHLHGRAFAALVDNALKTSYKVMISGSTYDLRPELKNAGFSFERNGSEKYWYRTERSREEALARQNELELMARRGALAVSVSVLEQTARTRYKAE